MSPTAVSCDVCGNVVGRSAPLSSDGGTIPPPTQIVPPTAPTYGYGPHGASAMSQGEIPPDAPGQPVWAAPPGAGPPGYPPPGYGMAPGGYGMAPGYGQRTNSKAVTSLVLGIVGLVICQPAAFFAIVLAGQAQREIRFSGGVETGEGLATAGRILGWIGAVLFVITIIAIFVLVFAGVRTAPR